MQHDSAGEVFREIGQRGEAGVRDGERERYKVERDTVSRTDARTTKIGFKEILDPINFSGGCN